MTAWFLPLLLFLHPDMDDGGDEPPPPPSVITDARVNDVFFIYAVEDFVASTRDVRHFEGVLPPDLLSAVRCLACDRYGCRELATEFLRRDPGGVRAACWGVRAANGEIRKRSVRLLREALRCPHCEGSGYCPAKYREGHDGGAAAWYADPTRHCEGCYRMPDWPWVPWGSVWRDRLRMLCRNCYGRGDLLWTLELPAPVR